MTDRQIGQSIGALFLLQLVMGIVNMQVLTAPLFGDPGYLQTASHHSVSLGISVLLGLVGSLITLAIAICAFPILNARSRMTAMAFLALSIVAASLTAVEQVGILGMREFSTAYAAAGPDSQAVFETLRVAGTLLRNGVHYVGLLFFGISMMLWYGSLLRFALLPRLIPAFGLCAVCLQLYTISLPVLGGEVSFLLLAPMGLAQLTQSLWLLIFGFRERVV